MAEPPKESKWREALECAVGVGALVLIVGLFWGIGHTYGNQGERISKDFAAIKQEKVREKAAAFHEGVTLIINDRFGSVRIE